MKLNVRFRPPLCPMSLALVAVAALFISRPIGTTMSAELRGTRCHVAWGAKLKGR
mgnify:CR=1 FL=1